MGERPVIRHLCLDIIKNKMWWKNSIFYRLLFFLAKKKHHAFSAIFFQSLPGQVHHKNRHFRGFNVNITVKFEIKEEEEEQEQEFRRTNTNYFSMFGLPEIWSEITFFYAFLGKQNKIRGFLCFSFFGGDVKLYLKKTPHQLVSALIPGGGQ